MRVRVFRDAVHLAESASEEIAAWLRVDNELPTIGLAGGSTPHRTYELLRKMRLPWQDIHVWMTDERFVPPDHVDNNGRMAREVLLDHVAAVFHEVPYLFDDPVGAASAYEEELASMLPVGSGGIEAGLVLLGLGEDGHTASLFPGTAAVDETRRGYVANWVDDRGWRLTATLPLLASARRTMFIVSGASKADIVAEILEDGAETSAAEVSRRARDAVWLLDREAASKLSLA